jgi:phosphohistidine swiveling domain-containing protein
VLEGSGAWSGAFTSYLDVGPGELEVAIRGCWASAFAVSTLARYAAAAIPPGSALMAVVVQPALIPAFGGTVRLAGEDVIVDAVAGSPAPLVGGWDPGVRARVTPAGDVGGDEAIALLGRARLRALADELLRARSLIGATACEWAIDGEKVVLLQLMRSPEARPTPREVPAALRTGAAARLVRAIRRSPGALGEALVLPWALADPTGAIDRDASADPQTLASTDAADPAEALREAHRLCELLAAQAWEMPGPVALEQAREVLVALRGADPANAIARLSALRVPDPEVSARVPALLARVRAGLAEIGEVASPWLAWHVTPERAAEVLAGGRDPRRRSRIGFDRWEPLDASVVLGTGRVASGVAAAAGIASGRLCVILEPAQATRFRARDVVLTTHPLPYLGPLLWDAAAIVTSGGGPAAHLFESARALGIPAVCGLHLDEALGQPVESATGRYAIAVDGEAGTASVTEW